MRWLGDITDTMDMNLSKIQEMMKDSEARDAALHGVTKSWAQLRNCKTTTNVVALTEKHRLYVTRYD